MFTQTYIFNAGTQLDLPHCAYKMHHLEELEDSDKLSLLHMCEPTYALDR